MKTNPSARWIVRMRITMLCLAIAGMVAAEFGLGRSVAGRVGQMTATRTNAPQAPNMDISDLMATVR
jgi:hypothetical protein